MSESTAQLVTLHGVAEPRGLDYVPRSSTTDGRFGRLFRRLSPCEHYDDGTLETLANSMRDESAPSGWSPSTPSQDGDNGNIPAGYTYLGQFLDHDITFDPVSSLTRVNDPDALENFRTPRFDLDSVYGSGPRDEPFQYGLRTEPPKLLTATNGSGEIDLPRNAQEVALTGDPRNDENKIVAQLHTVFLRLHNRLLDEVVSADTALTSGQQFERAQQLARWHYQWVMVDDFLRRITDPAVFDKKWRPSTSSTKRHDARLKYYRAKVNAYMPVEFSVAGFRFGHSMVRSTYDLNASITQIPIFAAGDQSPVGDLRGGNVLPNGWGVDWSLFFGMDAGGVSQPSRQINTKLSTALFDLPHGGGSLALRNFRRGQALQLPSGQAVARHLKAPVVHEAADINGGVLPGETPLWFYLLKEAELEQSGLRLGFCGSVIVTETLLGLLEADKHSFMNAGDVWVPEQVSAGATYGMPDLIRHALGG